MGSRKETQWGGGGGGEGKVRRVPGNTRAVVLISVVLQNLINIYHTVCVAVNWTLLNFAKILISSNV